MHRDEQAGFSLPELLVAMLVLSFVLLGVTSVYVSNHRTYDRGQTRAETQQNGRTGIEMLSRELRMAGFDPLNQISLQSIPAVFQVATADTLTFLADLNGDDTLDRVTYRRLGARLVREFSSWDGVGFPIPASGDVADGLSQFDLAYFDGNNAALAAPVTGTTLWDIRRINVTLRTAGRTVEDLEATYDLSIDVRPRNLR